MANYYIVHAGVKGMKWGHRKARQATGGSTRGSSSASADREVRRARAKKTKTKGQRMAGRILGGVGTSVGLGMLSGAAQRALLMRGHEAAAEIVKYAAVGMDVANVVKTVKDSVKIGKDSRDRW